MMLSHRPWWIKAGVQGALSLLPNPQRWNRVLQRYMTRSIYLRPKTFERKWQQVLRHHANWTSHRSSPLCTALELGTGWHPIIPLGLAVLGVERVYTLDIASMVSERTLAETAAAYEILIDERSSEEPRFREDRVQLLRELRRGPIGDPRKALARLGVELVVADARQTGLPSGSVDLLLSNNTLEHLPHATIVGVFEEFGRLASSTGLMSNFIDMADHYASFDSSITVYNFLKFSDSSWRLFNNDLQYQNRLRLPQFREIHAQTGWHLVDEDNTCDPDAFSRVNLAPRFRRYPRQDCMVYASWMVSTPS